MNNDDLTRLIMAIRNDAPGWFIGDVKEATVEALEELQELRAIREECKELIAGR